MRTVTFIAVAALLVVLGTSEISSAAAIEVQVGASLVNMIWQQSPPAFEPSSVWSNLGISTVVNNMMFEATVAFWDFRTMKLNDPLSFVLNASTEVSRLSGFPVEVVGGATITPNPMWIGLHAGARLRVMLYEGLIVSSGIFVAGTQGARDFPGGLALGASLGVAWSWALPFGGM